VIAARPGHAGSRSRRLDEAGVQRWSLIDAPEDLAVHQ
jgi:hypothetical protein